VWRRALVFAVLVGALLPRAPAQPISPPGVRGVAGAMATRSVSRYLGLERSLQDALERRDRAAALALLADDFTLRTSASADVESAGDWLKREFASGHTEGLVRDLSVREIDDLAIVSFLLDRGPVGHRPTATWFVVDVWRQSTQHLLARSMSRAAGAQRAPSRPSGRE
jgi:hypothetical protein